MSTNRIEISILNPTNDVLEYWFKSSYIKSFKDDLRLTIVSTLWMLGILTKLMMPKSDLKVCITCYMEIKLEMTTESEYDLSVK